MHLAHEFERALAGIPNSTLAVAVSGGGDSMALLHMLAPRGVRAVTVDHGLRDESAEEAAFVASVCAELGVPHVILKWQDWDGKGNLQDAARRARLRLIGDWARGAGVTHIALGHTFDDQAETVLLRLARGSGVDGVSGMAAARQDDDLVWFRPLMHARRDELREYLRAKGADWVEDPSNDNPKYDRVKARLALAHLADLGIDKEGLVSTAEKMRSARVVLETAAVQLAEACVEVDVAGEVRLDQQVFDAAADETRYRLSAAVLCWVSGAVYRPRFDSLRGLLADVEKGGQTLHGCVVRSHSGKIIVRRELARVQSARPVEHGIWDHRWKVSADAGAPLAETIGALGVDGLQQCENWRDTGHAREVLLASPALWRGHELVAAPLAGLQNGWNCGLIDEKGLHKSLMTR